MKNETPLRKSNNPAINSRYRVPWRRHFLLTLLVLGYLCALPRAQAGCQEGCGFDPSNTFLGNDALLSNTCSGNTAMGADALVSNSTGANNTAVGLSALQNNIAGVANTAVGAGALH